MGKTISELIRRLFDLYQKAEDLNKFIQIEKKSPGNIKKIKLQRQFLSDNIKSINQQLKNLVNGTITTVVVKVDSLFYKGIFLNRSKSEIEDYYKFISYLRGVNIEIISIDVIKINPFMVYNPRN